MKESIIFNDQNLTEKVHYVYRVTIDEQYYGGKHTGLLTDLVTGRYKTSSKLIHEKLKNGHHFSKIKILGIFSTKEEALEFEEKYLTRVNARRNSKFLNQTNGDKNFYVEQHTEETKAKMSKSQIERYNPETERGQRNKENHSKIMTEFYKTERGLEAKEKMSKSLKEFYKTERGIKRKENSSEFMKEFYNPETEEGRKNLEIQTEFQSKVWDKNTERGKKLRENLSEKGKERFNPETEAGRKNRENLEERAKVGRQKSAEIRLQKRINDSILGELMFNEAFIRENFLIIDDKNNQRFLHSVYSKLSGYSKSQIAYHKREGKLNFLHGINSISLTEEFENSKIKEIECSLRKA